MIQIPSLVCKRCGQFSGANFEAYHHSETLALEMLRQNTTAPDTHHRAEAILRKGNADISFLDREISKLQTTLFHLEWQRQIVQTRVNMNKALLAPIRRIPVEILQQIFTFCFPFVSTADTKWLPFQVSHVCAHWRFVASTMPDLWSEIDLDLVGFSMGFIDERLRIYKRFVSLAHEQSGTWPITMAIRAPALSSTALEEFSGLDPDLLISTFSLEFSDLWAKLSIDIDLLIFVQTQWGINLKLPAAKSLALFDDPRNHTACCAPDDMTQLTHLMLSSCSAPVTRLVGMPWSQITHLEARRVHINDLSAVLRQMPTLTHAHLAPDGLRANVAPVLQAIYLPRLRDLTLSCHSQALTCAVASSLTTPILSRFRVAVPPGPDAPQFQPLGQTLRAFMDRSSPPITHLGLQCISSQDMKDTFEALATVESLDLSILDDSNAIMNQLVWNSQPGGSPELNVTNLLPNLRMLTVRRANLNGALPGIIEMLCSRLNDHVTMMGLRDHPRPASLHTVCFRGHMGSRSSELLFELRQLGVVVDCMQELRGTDIQHLDISTIWPL